MMNETINLAIDDFPENVVIYRYENDDFSFVDINKHAQKSENISKEELIGKKLTEVFPGVKKFGLYDLLIKVHNEGGEESLDMTFYEDERISGWKHNSIRKLSNGDIIVFYKDLSEYKIIEEKYIRQTDNLNESQRATHIGTWFWDIRTNKMECSDEVYRIFGEKPQSFEARYENFSSYLSTVDQVRLQTAVHEAIKNKTPYKLEHEVICKDTQVRYVQASGKIQYNEVGEAISMIGSVLDITNEKYKEDKLYSLGKIIENSMHEVYIFDAQTLLFTYVNKAAQKHIGYSFDEIKTMSPVDIKPQYDLEKFSKLLEPLLNKEIRSVFVETLHKCKNNSLYDVKLHIELLQVDHKNHFLVTANDITSIKKTKEQIKLLSQAIEQTDALVRITDKDSVITYINEAFIAHTGYKEIELIGKKSSILKSGKHEEVFYKQLWDTILAGGTHRGIVINKKKDANFYYEEQTITPILDVNKNITHFVVTSQDITQRVQMEEKLKVLATVDSLTEIYNRYKMNEEIDSEIARNLRYAEFFSLVMFDIDHFKCVNDNFGHDVGDLVLKSLSSLVEQYIRDTDKFGRWGGEEFMLLLPNTSKEEAAITAEKIRGVVAGYPFKQVSQITISLGVSTFSLGDSKEKILKRVDNALYDAKENGRNRVEVI